MTDRQAWRNTHPQYQIEKLKTQYQTMQQLRDQRELPKCSDVARVHWSPEEMISAYKPQTRWMKNCASMPNTSQMMMREQYSRDIPEVTLLVPRNFGPVSSVSNSMWKDQGPGEKEGQQPSVGNSLDFFHNKREEEKRMNAEKE